MPSFERPAQVEHRAVIEGLPADKIGFFHQFARDHIERPADVAVDHMALAVGRRNRAARSAKIDSHAECFIAFFHELTAFPVG